MIRKLLTAGALAFFAAISASPAQADLLDGRVVEINYHFPDLMTVEDGPRYNAVGLSDPTLIAPGLGSYFLRATFSGTRITLDSPIADGTPGNYLSFFGGAPFHGLAFSDAYGSIEPFTGFSVSNLTTVAGFGAERLSFDADHLYVELGLLTINNGERIVLDIQSNPTTSPAPEPAVWAMMAVGFGLIGAAARRSKPNLHYA